MRSGPGPRVKRAPVSASYGSAIPHVHRVLGEDGRMSVRDRGHAEHAIEPTEPSRTPSADDGVDVTLIRWMLSLTPKQRLSVLQRNVASILRPRDARSGD